MGDVFLSLLMVGILCCIFILCGRTFYTIRHWKRGEGKTFFPNNPPARFYITGDKHRNFNAVKSFCQITGTTKDDVLIILGDAGFNYYGDKRDDRLKQDMSHLPITLFCLHGNKENRPQNIGTYGVRNFYGGKVYYEPRYPNILFAIDGEVYRFNGKEYLVIGGAHSVDKPYCIAKHKPFWDDEMPSAETKKHVEDALMRKEWKIHGILTHTCPLKYIPTEMFVSTKRSVTNKRHSEKKSFKKYPLDIDRSTEIWLNEIEEKTQYDLWYCGHYHVDKSVDRIQMMHKHIRLLDRVKGADLL